MILKKYSLVILAFLFFINSVEAKETKPDIDSIVAKIGNDYKITFNDLYKYVVDWQYNIKYREKNECYKTALDALILNQLKRFDFFEKGLDKNEEIMRGILRTINEEITVEYYDKQFVAKYSNENAAEDAYKIMDKEILYYEVYYPLKGDEKQTKVDSLKNIALKVEKELRDSKDINKSINKFTQKKVCDGSQRTVKWEQSLIDPVGKVVFKLRKGNTKTIKTIDGFHIVRIIDVQKINLEPFDKIKTEIIKKIKESNSERCYNEYEALKKSCVDTSSLKWNQDGLGKIIVWSNIPKFYRGAYVDTMSSHLKKGDNFEIVSYNNGKIDLKEYFRLLDEVYLMNAEDTITISKMKGFILEAIYSDFIVKKAWQLNLGKKFFNPYTNNFYLKHRIAFQYNKAMVDNKMPEATEEALQKFYSEQKDSVLYQLSKVTIYARIYSDSTKAVEEMKRINEGVSFEKYSDRWFIKSFTKEQSGIYNSYLSSEPPYLAEAAFKLNVHEVAGPIFYFDKEKGKQYAVITCVEKRPAGQLSYEELKPKLKDVFLNYYRQYFEKKVEKELKAKYKVEVYNDVLSYYISIVK